ncbi:MAG TPA: 4-alpha-glucanotransferase, partial [Burkholderiales bacterium]|nr:4-alpha-glucanotransferase [Burkholderiales bacterium]
MREHRARPPHIFLFRHTVAGLHLLRVSVGAPPDPLGPDGQNWGLPPVDPAALRADGYRYWSALIRGSLR